MGSGVVRWLCGDLLGTEVEHGKWSGALAVW
jgi:hypothetical protein